MPFKDKEYAKKYDRERNKTEIRREQHRKTYQKHKEKYSSNRKKYYLKNKDKIIKHVHEYYLKHRAKLTLYRRGYKRRKKCEGLNVSEELYSELTKLCGICGFTELVDLHHIDCDRNNNSLNNLIGLCPNHHLLIHRKNKDFSKEIQINIKNRRLENDH